MLLNHEVHTTSSLTDNLKVYGWSHLDAVLLAALVTESPLLLIGAHGTAKTYLVERIAGALNLTFRHYNASLINYDDLVGIPLPDEKNQQLHFVSTKGAIWDAEFVFFDEISRCRPDLQNKLFPIIHEKRIVGIDLENLRFRWAAMNPPSPDDPDMDAATTEMYLGSEPLDPALTDRFPFVLPVPTWDELSKEDRRKLVSLRDETGKPTTLEFSLEEIVKRCEDNRIQVTEAWGEWLTDYIVYLMDLLDKANLPQSPRRARMLAHTIIAIHSARLVLEGQAIDFADSAELGLLYGLPQTASEVPPSPATIISVHRQAWEIANCMDDDSWRAVMEETDQIKRVVLADDLGFSDEDLSHLVTQALNVGQSDAEKVALATAIFLSMYRYRNLTPAAWEPLVQLCGYVLQPATFSLSVANNSNDMRTWNEIRDWAIKRRDEGEMGQLEVNYVLGGFPETWRKCSWQESLGKLREYLNVFNVTEVYGE